MFVSNAARPDYIGYGLMWNFYSVKLSTPISNR